MGRTTDHKKNYILNELRNIDGAIKKDVFFHLVHVPFGMSKREYNSILEELNDTYVIDIKREGSDIIIEALGPAGIARKRLEDA